MGARSRKGRRRMRGKGERERLAATFCISLRNPGLGQVRMTPLEPGTASCGDLGCDVLAPGTVPGIP